MDGIIPLWKPKGLTSHDCVMKIRKIFHTKKVGHTGTLDPEVEGVLPICIGQATKIVQFLTDTKKTYIARVALGSATDTEDASGKIIQQQDVTSRHTKQAIESVLQSFTGEINQIPPMYSAVKVNGKKLYEYARENKPVERPVRTVTIHELKLLEQLDDDMFEIKAVCSKGTYIRTLCVDIGKQLGYPAHMAALIRTSTGSIEASDTVTFDAIEQAVALGNEASVLLPVSRGLTHLDNVIVDKETRERVLNGQKLPKVHQTKTDPFVMMYENQVLAVYQTHPEKSKLVKPVRVFQV